VALGYYGDYKSVGEGVYELRFAFGPGYRIYFVEAGKDKIILLCAGDKSTQGKDIERARLYFKDIEDGDNE
jgi:putative addiction module killer protein